jgi:hypothetical protein
MIAGSFKLFEIGGTVVRVHPGVRVASEQNY